METNDHAYTRIVQRGNRRTEKFIRAWFRFLVFFGVFLSILSVTLLGYYPELDTGEAGAAPVVVWNLLIVTIMCLDGLTVALLRVIARFQQHHLNAWDQKVLNLADVLFLFAIAMCGFGIFTGPFVFWRKL